MVVYEILVVDFLCFDWKQWKATAQIKHVDCDHREL
jgi:hypothetical protein